MLQPSQNYNGKMHKYYTGTGGLKKGTIAKLDSGTAILAAEGIASAILLGVAAEDYDAGEICSLYPPDIEYDINIYQGGATDTFAAANVGTPFDIYVDGTSKDMSLDANDTTGAFCVLMGYDNALQKAQIRFLSTVNYLA